MLKLTALILTCLLMTHPALPLLGEPQTAEQYSSVGAIAVMETQSLQCALEYNADKVLPAAGLSRLPALLYICEALDSGAADENAALSVSAEAAGIGGPTAFIETGERITAGQLVKAAVMITAGDACYALAEHIAGSAPLAQEAICAILTQLNIGCGDFSLKTGKQNYTAKELCRIAARLSRSATYVKYSGLTYDTISHENAGETELANPNKLIRSLGGCFGGSTGSSADAGYCGVFMAKSGDTSYVAAVVGATDSAKRFSVASQGISEAFATYENKALARAGDVIIKDLPVECGMVGSIDAIASSDVVMLVKKGENVTLNIEKPDSVSAPVKQGDTVAYAVYSSEYGTNTAKIELKASRDVEQAGWKALIWAIMRRYVHGAER